jgi:hypothetical protein
VAINKQQQAKAKAGRSSQGSQRDVLKPMIHQDCFFLRVTAPSPSEAASNAPPTVRWEKRRRPANAPAPTRAGATMAYHKGRGILFGGVHDVEESEEGMDSEFFNGLFAWNVERNRFFPLTLRRPRAPRSDQREQRVGGRRGRAQVNEEELLAQLAALQSVGPSDPMDVDEFPGRKGEAVDEDEKPVRDMPVVMEYPHPRFNAQLAVQGDVLYIYGGTFEKGDREFTFDDLYAVDLGKMDGCKEIFSRPVEDWVVSVFMRTFVGWLS